MSSPSVEFAQLMSLRCRQSPASPFPHNRKRAGNRRTAAGRTRGGMDETWFLRFKRQFLPDFCIVTASLVFDIGNFRLGLRYKFQMSSARLRKQAFYRDRFLAEILQSDRMDTNDQLDSVIISIGRSKSVLMEPKGKRHRKLIFPRTIHRFAASVFPFHHFG